MSFGADDLGHVGVPEHEVGVRAHRDATLAWEQVVDLGCICAGHCHKLVFIHFTSDLMGKVTVLASKGAEAEMVVGRGLRKLTTHLSQIRDILSSVPLVPSGIKVKLSFPTARWEVWKVQWPLPVTWRSPLGNRTGKSFSQMLKDTNANAWISTRTTAT